MSADTPLFSNLWTRRLYQPGGGDALLYYLIPGEFSDTTVPRIANNSPAMIEHWTRQTQGARFDALLGGALGRLLDTEHAALAPRVRATDSLLAVRAVVPDPRDLTYLRDTQQIVCAALEAGGIAVLDAMALEWWERDTFLQEHRQSDVAADPLRQTTILISEDERDRDGRPTVWVHTRGMRKFGRPDISRREVPEPLVGLVVALCNRLIVYQAQGGIVAEGQPVRLPGIAEELTLHYAGDLDDPDFNNVHWSVRGPLRTV